MKELKASQQSHTPGPWQQNSGIFYLIQGDDGEGVAEIRTTYRNKTEAKANARLVAVAPELLAMLQEWLQAGVINPKDDERAKRSFALIAKATGVA